MDDRLGRFLSLILPATKNFNRELSNRSSFLRLLSTFVVVFLAVAAALAADSWRDTLSEKRDADQSQNEKSEIKSHGYQSVISSLILVLYGV